VHGANIQEDQNGPDGVISLTEHDVEFRMSVAEYDARDVLDSYLCALSRLNQSSVCDAADLRYPKDLIKFVLRHCIKTIEEDDKRTFLRNAYLSLANFHDLTDEERAAARLISETGTSGGQSEEVEARIRDATTSLRAAIERYIAEVAILEQELKILEADDPTRAPAV
jgi:hypothetical protein